MITARFPCQETDRACAFFADRLPGLMIEISSDNARQVDLVDMYACISLAYNVVDAVRTWNNVNPDMEARAVHPALQRPGSVCVYNLPPMATRTSLYQRFARYGAIDGANITLNPKGAMGFVNFRRTEDAIAAEIYEKNVKLQGPRRRVLA